jgi:predicted ArsR family transcriptional regulator
MGAHPMLDPDSTVRLVYEALSVGKVMTQAELCQRVVRTKGAVCKALKRLSDEGYARRTQSAPPRRRVGRPSLGFVRTEKDWRSGEVRVSAPAALELTQIVNAIVRDGARRKRK